ncbi:hypothetical protein [Halovulum marinum]|nr:hypothetical protein [Halovulum marinum]
MFLLVSAAIDGLPERLPGLIACAIVVTISRALHRRADRLRSPRAA